jgi:hypothetical protein
MVVGGMVGSWFVFVASGIQELALSLTQVNATCGLARGQVYAAFCTFPHRCFPEVCLHDKLSNMSTASKLDAIARLAPSLQLSPHAHAVRTQLFARQSDLIRKLWPDAKTIAVGSYTQALAIRGSDLDIVMWPGSEPATVSWAKRLFYANIVERLAKPGPMKLLGIRSPVPVLKYVSAVSDGEEDFTVDVSWQPPETMIRRDQFVVMQLERWPGAREALLALKTWSRAKGFDVAFNGGLGSYGLALSLIAVLNSLKVPPSSPWEIIREYLARVTDPERKMFGGLFNIHTGECEPLPPIKYPNRLLLLRCPIVHTQIVGKNANKINGVVKGMEELLAEMEAVGPEMSLEDAQRLFTPPPVPKRLPAHLSMTEPKGPIKVRRVETVQSGTEYRVLSMSGSKAPSSESKAAEEAASVEEKVERNYERRLEKKVQEATTEELISMDELVDSFKKEAVEEKVKMEKMVKEATTEELISMLELVDSFKKDALEEKVEEAVTQRKEEKPSTDQVTPVETLAETAENNIVEKEEEQQSLAASQSS